MITTSSKLVAEATELLRKIEDLANIADYVDSLEENHSDYTKNVGKGQSDCLLEMIEHNLEVEYPKLEKAYCEAQELLGNVRRLLDKLL